MNDQPQRAEMTHALALRQLAKRYANGFDALKGIDLEIAPGEFFALLGPNGAGKSTTIGIICSLVNKTSGTVEIFGHSLDRERATAKRLIGLVPQEFNFGSFEKVFDICVNQAGFYGLPRALAKARAEQYLKQLDLWDRAGQAARFLSGGMKRRLMIARALVHEPRLLILDEPTAGVDIEMRHATWEFLKRINAEGTTIILTTHYLEEAEHLCRRIAIIDQGQIIENTTMRSLLAKLNRETFVLDVAEPIRELPEFPGHHHVTRIDDMTLEAEISKECPINDLFAELSARGIRVLSMRNKTNRLEQLFLGLVEKKLTVSA